MTAIKISELCTILLDIGLTAFNFLDKLSIKFCEMGSSQSSEVYDFRSFKICDGVSVGQISTMLSTSASDLRDCIKSAASVSDDAGDTIVSGCGGGVCTMKRE